MSANLTHSIVSRWRAIMQQLMLIMIRLNHLYHSLLLLHGKFYRGFGILRTSLNHLLIYIGDFFLVTKECNMFYSKMARFLWGERNLTENFQGVFSVSECKSSCIARYSFLLKDLLGKSFCITTSPPSVQMASLWAACRSLYRGAQEPGKWRSSWKCN